MKVYRFKFVDFVYLQLSYVVYYYAPPYPEGALAAVKMMIVVAVWCPGEGYCGTISKSSKSPPVLPFSALFLMEFVYSIQVSCWFCCWFPVSPPIGCDCNYHLFLLYELLPHSMS